MIFNQNIRRIMTEIRGFMGRLRLKTSESGNFNRNYSERSAKTAVLKRIGFLYLKLLHPSFKENE